MAETAFQPNNRLLSVEGVTVSFGPERPAVNAADLMLTCGRVTALLGPSGSGKSTLLRAIAGLERLDRGQITFENSQWSGPGVHLPPEARRCGVVFQDYALFPHLSAVQNVAYGLREGSRAERLERARTQLETVELAHRAEAYPHELSGGEQQRVALARALAPVPDVILLDEPFSGLDRRLRSEVRQATAEALNASNVATLLVTHDSEEAMALADTIALMSEGRIIQTGNPDQLYLKPASFQAARLLGGVEAFETQIETGRAACELGQIEAADLDEGSKAMLLVRPEGIKVRNTSHEGALARIVERRASAGAARLICVLDGRDRRVEAHVSLADPTRVGDGVRLSLDPYFATVVPG